MKLETLLKKEHIPYSKSRHEPAYTSQELAQVEHVPGRERGFAMCVIPASARLDLVKTAEVLQEFEVVMATEGEMMKLFPDCELGAEPPVGRLFGIKTLIDESLELDEYVVMQCGRHTESIRVAREDYERLCRPIVADIIVGP
jgi:Ala-tRNA(Pro) deacylase